MSSSQSAVSYLQHRDYPSPLSSQSEIMLKGTSDVSLLLCSILSLFTWAGAEVTTYTDLSTNQVSSHTSAYVDHVDHVDHVPGSSRQQ